ncbi:hypothetical protein PABG_11289 [Paracoccidioides brasiliensis Pb03]|nr:hypothetical protein PABG_11289 [Paracoccidioides brasiliensis Pb03]
MSDDSPKEYSSARHAPNPPKLDVLDLATSVSGKKASSISRSRRTRLCAIDVPYTLLDCVGREGSCRVCRIIAENNDVFTLKRANLRDVNEATVRRNRSEIDQLKKLAKTPNSTLCSNDITGKRCLNVSLRYTLTTLYTPTSFKRAKFVLVRGRLEIIIVFSIANLIGDDTVNRYLELGLHIISNNIREGSARPYTKSSAQCHAHYQSNHTIDYPALGISGVKLPAGHHPSLASMLEAGAKAASDHRRSSLPVRRIPIAR